MPSSGCCGSCWAGWSPPRQCLLFMCWGAGGGITRVAWDLGCGAMLLRSLFKILKLWFKAILAGAGIGCEAMLSLATGLKYRTRRSSSYNHLRNFVTLFIPYLKSFKTKKKTIPHDTAISKIGWLGYYGKFDMPIINNYSCGRVFFLFLLLIRLICRVLVCMVGICLRLSALSPHNTFSKDLPAAQMFSHRSIC